MIDSMADEPKDAAASSESETISSTSKKVTKKTTKKAAKKATKKKTTKKAAKKTAKKTAKKAAKKKVTKKASAESESDDSSTEEGTEDAEMVVSASDDAGESTPESADSDSDDGSDDESDSASKKKTTRKRSSKKASKTSSKSTKSSSTKKSKADEKRPYTEMIVNYVPGEDCRIAIVEDGQLEDVFSENTNKVSRVNNIYVGKVTNVEASIQAAFVDFGTELNGFLHISDIHPQYFAKGDDKTERVGKKTPHRDRPPIQDCLKRGQEIIVQVLKEGVGTKGPSLTSYLSIPGRFLVMMPGMDKVGVSRKEEDDDKRKAAKTILNGLDLPEGFGFILRTAGFDRTKTELKRDLAYLNRLWADMEKRRKSGKKPRLLYSESDLLVRTVRDLLSSDMDRVVIDSEAALKRVARFVKIAAPRSHAKLAHYVGTAPIFHAFDIEKQIENIHAREVELPSGGRLVIDQTEALVAIDVNSGKSRGAKDAETNAYKTNLEAVDAICRQIRLRDLGGLVVNDLIDMRYASHRRDIENRFRDRLKRDRAKTTVGPISDFGLLEMTRQRMRGSMESQHFADCPTCRGRGLVQRPGSVADGALRDLAAIMDHKSVHRAELVVHPRVASELLSTKRSALIRVELGSGKSVDVRVSDALPMDRFSIYAYEKNGNDIDTEKLTKKSKPKPNVVEWSKIDTDDSSWAIDLKEESDESTVLKLAEDFAKKAEQAENAELPIDDSKPLIDENGEPVKKKRRRRRRGRGRGEGSDSTESTNDSENIKNENTDTSESSSEERNKDHAENETNEDGTPRKKRRRRRGRGRGSKSEGDSGSAESTEEKNGEPVAEKNSDKKTDDKGNEKPKKSRSRSKSTKEAQSESKSSSEPVAEPKPRRRGLYSGGRRKLSSAEVASIDRDAL
ncbi:MAG: Rne/Rng family ribonuclease [Phycisphaerales bacterium]|nr:Rne/Rng family ribonuclease [Phycisphaerales bacterium]